jgi:low affinity Fe/Cu permease
MNGNDLPDDGSAPAGERHSRRSPARVLAGFANWFNEFVMGSPWMYLAALVLVLAVDALIPIQGYSKWNLTTGLFSNTQESSFELITGIGAIVGVYSIKRMTKQHQADLRALHEHFRREIAALHHKLDEVHRHVTTPALPDAEFAPQADTASPQ